MTLIEIPEYWDLYDHNGKLKGKIRKGCAIPGGLYHVSVEVIPTDSQGHILLVQRAACKRAAGKYEFPTGSALAGEKHIMAAIRELREETGLKPQKLILLQSNKTPYSPYSSGLIRLTYIAHIPDLLNQQVTLQPDETSDYKIVSLDQMKRDFIAGGLFNLASLAFYKNDFWDKLENIIGKPEGEDSNTDETQTAKKQRPVFKKVSHEM